MSCISFEGVSKRYGRRQAVRELSFEVAPGACFGLVGPNGAGKSTTLKLMLGLVKPSAGRVKLNGQDPWRRPEARRAIGYLPERSALYPELSCAQTVAYSARFYGLSPSDDDIRELREDAENAIGDVRLVEADFAFRAGWNPESRLLNPELAGGGLLALAYVAGLRRAWPETRMLAPLLLASTAAFALWRTLDGRIHETAAWLLAGLVFALLAGALTLARRRLEGRP